MGKPDARTAFERLTRARMADTALREALRCLGALEAPQTASRVRAALLSCQDTVARYKQRWDRAMDEELTQRGRALAIGFFQPDEKESTK